MEAARGTSAAIPNRKNSTGATRHYWLSHKGKHKDTCSKCTRCGLIKERAADKTHLVYFRGGETFTVLPDCRPIEA